MSEAKIINKKKAINTVEKAVAKAFKEIEDGNGDLKKEVRPLQIIGCKEVYSMFNYLNYYSSHANLARKR